MGFAPGNGQIRNPSGLFMNRYLLAASIAVVLGGSVAGFNTGQSSLESERIIENGEVIAETVKSDVVGWLPRTVASADSVELTVKWVKSTDKNAKDGSVSNYVIVDNEGHFINIDSKVLSKCKNNTYVMKLPRGVYQTVLSMATKTPEANSLGKYIFKEDVDLRSDTVLIYDGNTATRRIKFEYVNPKGEKLNLWDKLSSSQSNYEGANISGFYSLRILGHKKANGLALGTHYLCPYDYPGVTGSDRVRSNDVFVNEVKSGDWMLGTNFKAFVLDPEKKERSKKDPLLLGTKIVYFNKLDTVYRLNPSEYVTYRLPEFKKSLSKAIYDKPYTGDYRFENIAFGNFSIGGDIISSSREDAPALCGVMDPDLPVLVSFTTHETNSVPFPSASFGSGIATPKMLLQNDATVRYLMNDNIYEGIAYIYYKNGMTGDRLATSHPALEYCSVDNEPQFGTTAPCFSMPIMTTPPNVKVKYKYPYSFSNAQWLGNFGERRTIDLFEMDYVMLAGTDTIVREWSEFESKMTEYGSKDHAPAVVKTIIDNRNFTVDSLQGHTHVEMSYNEANSDVATPTVQMVQFRNGDGKITNKFDKENDGTIEICYGDFEFDFDLTEYDVRKCNLKLEVAPYGTEDFRELKAVEDAGMFRMPVWGYFSRAGIGSLPTAGNGWWDLKISLTDNAGNMQIQTLSPAFYARYSDPAGVDEISDRAEATVVGIYDVNGMRRACYAEGINIVRYSDGSTKKVMIRK